MSDGNALRKSADEPAFVAPVGTNGDFVKHFEKHGVYGLGESYIEGEWDVPQLDQFLFDIISGSEPAASLTARARIIAYYLADKFRNPQQGEGAFNIGKVHYGLGNELFKLMLDRSMSYTCGYWKDAQDLDQAQEAKLELICRKLCLEPGMRVLDIGCGWGNFARYASKKYGVSVVGVTVSQPQAEFAREFCAGLPVEILLQDYRSITGQFDRVVSIEMIEAVGRKNLPTFFEVAHRALKPHGLFVLEVISCETVSSHSNRYMDQFLMWILKHIFPDGYLPKISELAAPGSDLFVIEDWHNFGSDYDLTLMSWAENFNRNWPQLEKSYGDRFKRRWNFYLYGCAAFFRARILQLYQIVYAKGGVQGCYSRIR